MSIPVIAAAKLGYDSLTGIRQEFRGHPVRFGVKLAAGLALPAAVLGGCNALAAAAPAIIHTETVATADGGDVEINQLTIPDDIKIAGVETTVTGATGTVREVVTVLGYEHQTSLAQTVLGFKAQTDVTYPASDIATRRFQQPGAEHYTRELIFDWRKLAIDTTVVNGSVWPENRAEGGAAFNEITAAAAEATGTDDWRPFGLDVAGVDSSNVIFNVTTGAALNAGLTASDDCVQKLVIPYAEAIFRRGVEQQFGPIVDAYGDEIVVTFEHGPSTGDDAAIQVKTEVDPRLVQILNNVDVETDPGTGACTASPEAQAIIDEAAQQQNTTTASTEAYAGLLGRGAYS